MTLWTVSIINHKHRIGSPYDNFLLALGGCEENYAVMLQYARNLREEIAALDRDGILVNGKHYNCTCSLVSANMKYLAVLSGELTNSASYFSSFADVCDSQKMDCSAMYNSSAAGSCCPSKGQVVW